MMSIEIHKNDEVVCVDTHQVSHEIEIGKIYTVREVIKSGEHPQDWYIHVEGVREDGEHGFCYRRFKRVSGSYLKGMEKADKAFEALFADKLLYNVDEWEGFMQTLKSKMVKFIEDGDYA